MITLRDAVKIYSICARSENKSPRTIEWVTGAVKQLTAFVGGTDIEIDAVNADLIRRFIVSLAERPAYCNHPFNKPSLRPVSSETRSCYVRALKSLFARLYTEGYINDNPLSRIKTPKVPIREPAILSENEISRLFNAIDKGSPEGYRNYAICLTLLDTGMRVSELSNLTQDDVDLENGYFRILGKGQKLHLVPMGYKLTRILLKYLTTYRYRDTGSRYFFLTRAGQAITRNRVGKIVRIYSRKAGIIGKRVYPHMFRATKAVLFLRNGGDPFTLQKCLGHSTLTMTRRYSAIVDADVKAAHLKHGVVDKLSI